MLRSIRSRIAVPYVILILLTMLGLGVFLSYFLRQIYLENLQNQLSTNVRMVGEAIQMDPDVLHDPELVNNLVGKWSGVINARLTVIDSDGIVLGDSHADYKTMENHANRPEISEAFLNGNGTSTRFSRTTSYRTVYVATSISDGNQNDFVVRVAYLLDDVQADITLLRRTLIGATLIVMLIATLLAIIIANSTTKPIRETTEAVAILAQQEIYKEIPPQPIELTTIDEVAQLVYAINLMAREVHMQVRNVELERSTLLSILQEMTDGVITVNQQGRIEMINPAAENMFSVKSESVYGISLAEGIRLHQVVELWQHCRDTRSTQYAMLEISATRQYIQGVATPLEKPAPGSVLLIFQNITHQRFLETVRRDFVSNISHELRTPLASLKALTETLLDSAIDDPQAARRFLKRMDAEVDALTQIVSELLQLSRVESGKVPFQMQLTKPDEIINPAVERLLLQADRAELSINVECPLGLPAILADPARLEQVVVNLLHNAIKFTPSGGEIRIKVRQQDDDHQDGGMMLFSISDTGIGIESEDLPRIFERFYKVDRARSSGGTGLGLAIARHTVEAHGGVIWAESVAKQGSTFYFTIPIAE